LLKVMPLDATHDDLGPTLGPEVVDGSTVIKDTQSLKFVPKKD
jgi:hypothetical protein